MSVRERVRETLLQNLGRGAFETLEAMHYKNDSALEVMIDRLLTAASPTREEIDIVLGRHGIGLWISGEIAYTGPHRYDQLRADLLRCWQPAPPEWCKKDCPRPWRWESKLWVRSDASDPERIITTANPDTKIRFCDACGAKRPGAS